MTSTDWNTATDDNEATVRADAPEACQAADLRALLGTIVEQLTDADRRQSDTLHQMQARLESMGQEANAMRGRVPPHLAPAFERIEAGMTELANRLAETGVPTGAIGSEKVKPVTTAPKSAARDETFSDDVVSDLDNRASAEVDDDVSSRIEFSNDDDFVADDQDVVDPPAALRTAGAEMARKDLGETKSPVDHFDVIESSIPGDVNDPWDRDAAEALSGVYETGGGNFAQDNPVVSYAPQSFASMSSNAGASTPPSNAGSRASLDADWLEKQFADINTRLDQSLADFNPDQSFFALGQRLDGVEAQIAEAVQGLSAASGAEQLRTVENQIGEIADYLEATTGKLTRLDDIEAQLGAVSGRLDEIYALATAAEAGGASGGEGAGYAAADLDAVARAAASEISQQFAAMHSATGAVPDVSDLRQLLEDFMGERREGDANMAASLDTLQQAVISLLDRAEAAEQAAGVGQVSYGPQSAADLPDQDAEFLAEPSFTTDEERQSYEGPVTEYVAEMQAGRKASRDHDDADESAHDITDAGSAADERMADAPAAKSRDARPARQPRSTARSAPTIDDSHLDADIDDAGPQQAAVESFGGDEEMPSQRTGRRTPAQMRQDFIADARRAKQKLADDAEAAAAEATSGDGKADADLIANLRKRPSEAAGATASTENSRYSQRAGAAKKVKTGGSAAPSPRLVVMGLGALLALGGLWYTLDGTSTGPVQLPHIESSQSNDAAPATEDDIAKGTATSVPKSSEGQPNGEFEILNPNPNTRGEIVPGDVIVGQSTVALPGLTVDSEQPMTAQGLEQASRRQSLANMSTKVGQAAAKMSNEVAVPTSLIPSDDGVPGIVSAAAGSDAKAADGSNPLAVSKPLDLPPATVGPLSLRLAAAQGDPSAEFQVGARFAEGKGIGQDFTEAGRWYQRSASRGFAQAQYRLGTLFERGLGMTADRARAEVWYKRAADSGNVKAMHNLAVMSTNSGGGSPDYMTAAEWFEKAAERGLSDSQFNLAVLYEHGLGVKQNLNTAYRWLLLAARGGDTEAVRRRDALKGKLSAADASATEKLVMSWRPKPTDKIANDARAAGEAWKKTSLNGYEN